jgi:hypothetical protein
MVRVLKVDNAGTLRTGPYIGQFGENVKIIPVLVLIIFEGKLLDEYVEYGDFGKAVAI